MIERFTLFRLMFWLMLLSLGSTVQAAIDVHKFDSAEQLQQYQQLTKELRCPKCQNQDIADSNAPIAKDMREQVYQMTLEGKDNQEIIDFMVDRFGEFVVYTPRFDGSTLLLWVGPIVVAVLGILVVVAGTRKKPDSTDALLSPEEQARLKKILEEDEKSS